MFQVGNTGGRTPLVRPAGNCEQGSGGEAEQQDVIACIEDLAAVNGQDEQEQRRSGENSAPGVNEPACGPASGAIHGSSQVPEDRGT